MYKWFILWLNRDYRMLSMLKIISKLIRYPYRFSIKLKFFNENNLKNKFSIIYNSNYWDDKESISGPGSSLKNTKNLRVTLNQIIKRYKIKTIVDAPCGDCNWIKLLIKKNKIKYTGIDIVKECIDNNILKFKKNKKFNFKNLDITRDKLPTADLFICRDFMIHLSFKDSERFLRNLKKINSKYILISNHSKLNGGSIFNKDIKSGDFRKINLFKKPYNFKTNYELAIKDDCDGVEKFIILFKKDKFQRY